jgi:hypothetical protein
MCRERPSLHESIPFTSEVEGTLAQRFANNTAYLTVILDQINISFHFVHNIGIIYLPELIPGNGKIEPQKAFWENLILLGCGIDPRMN